MRKLFEKISDWHSWIDYRNRLFWFKLIVSLSVTPVLTFLFINPLDLSLPLFQEKLADPLAVKVAIMLNIIGAAFLTWLNFGSEVENQKFAYWIELEQERERKEIENTWSYINNSQHKQFIEDTPDNLKDGLAKLLYYRHIALVEKEVKTVNN